MITLETPQPNCTPPVPSTRVPINVDRIFLWFLMAEVRAGDAFDAIWTAGDGSRFTSHRWVAREAGTLCFGSYISPSSSDLTPEKAGMWTIEVLENGRRAFTVRFEMIDVSGELPVVKDGGVAESWTYQRGVAPGAWISIFGEFLSMHAGQWRPVGGQPLQTALRGVTVRFDGVPAALSYVSGGLVNALAPATVGVGETTITVERDGLVSAPLTVSSKRMLPAIYCIPDTTVSPIRYYVTAALAGTATLIGTRRLDSRVVRSARPGDLLDLYAIGLGRTRGEFFTDRMFSGSFILADPIEVELDNRRIVPEYAGLISPGLYLVRIRIPDNVPNRDARIRLSNLWS
jgi:uncharacterized protein (TIGR03437 family)